MKVHQGMSHTMSNLMYPKAIFDAHAVAMITQGVDDDQVRHFIAQSDALTLCHGLIQISRQVPAVINLKVLEHLPLIAMRIHQMWPVQTAEQEQCLRALDYLMTEGSLSMSAIGLDMMYYLKPFAVRHRELVTQRKTTTTTAPSMGDRGHLMARQSLVPSMMWALQEGVLNDGEQKSLWETVLSHRPQAVAALYSSITHPHRDAMTMGKGVKMDSLQELDAVMDWGKSDGRLLIHAVVNGNKEAMAHVLPRVDVLSMARLYFDHINITVMLKTARLVWDHLNTKDRTSLISVVQHALRKEGARKVFKSSDHLELRQCFQSHKDHCRLWRALSQTTHSTNAEERGRRKM